MASYVIKLFDPLICCTVKNNYVRGEGEPRRARGLVDIMAGETINSVRDESLST